MKTLLEIGTSYPELERLAELGMGYQVLMATANGEPAAGPIVVAGSLVLPFAHDTHYSLEDLAHGIAPGPRIPCTLAGIAPLPAITTSSLPPGYVPVAGAVALLGTYVVNAPETYFRFVGGSRDWRFSAAATAPGSIGHLLPGTYLASDRERALLTSGFGAVGRLALPLPVPARDVFEYELLPSTLPSTLDVGTVAPAFGQSGGGAEAKTPSTKRLSVRFVRHTVLDDF